MTEFEKGYTKALEDINKPKEMIVKEWNPSKCPTCERSFDDLEECDDGYYKRVYSLDRCPYCGQKISWE